jgi:hypothetical protein
MESSVGGVGSWAETIPVMPNATTITANIPKLNFLNIYAPPAKFGVFHLRKTLVNIDQIVTEGCSKVVKKVLMFDLALGLFKNNFVLSNSFPT